MKTARIGVSGSRHVRLWMFFALAASLTIGGIAGAQSEDAVDRDGSGEVVTTITRLDALPGSTVLLPVIPAGARRDALLGPPAGWIPGNEPSVTIAGRPLRASLFRLDGAQRDARAGESWLPVALEWTSTAWGRARSIGVGGEASFWVLAVDLPEQPIARHLEVGGKRLPIRWLDPVPEKTDVARLPLLEASLEARRALGDFLRSEARDPFRRWRCALVADRFTSHSLWGDEPALVAFADPVLEAGAENAEARSRAAIEAARRIDPDLGAKLLSSLTAVVRMDDGGLLPAWPADDAETLELLSGLLDMGRSAAKKRADLEVWLSRAPSAVAWVVSDDAGGGAGGPPGAGEGGAGTRVVLVGIANLTDRQAICSCAPEGRAANNAEMLLAHRATVLRTTIDAGASGLRAGVVARVGTAGYPLTVVAAVPAAAPPGIDLGPLRPDWTMSTWMGGSPPMLDPARAATARLYAEPLDAEGEERRWRITIEARTPVDAPIEAKDTVRIWCGRAGEPDVVISVDGSGGASIDTGLTTERLRAEISRTERGWLATIELPAWLTRTQAVVEFGVVRVDPRGLRSAWPRPMMPGQTKPGRIPIGLTEWTRLEP